ncbi:Microsomal glutathione S-transferase 3 [Kickxella alabastrina]|uniref:Microsomal glutathione S-transferase 3 n=1 Tax=Kickxella alabastrina TaxID=61397 RepID=A0ACC1IID2_9FUNG|nr:Microsomal glutathione S-transferase 3 [Kickxella alabastrina]
MTIIIGSEFGYCVLAAIGIALQCSFTGHAVMNARKKFKVDYPDNGSGRYAAKLTEEDWLKFNNIKRVNDNYTEQISIVLSMLLMSGLYMPRAAAAFGVSYMVGRYIYGRGYIAGGAKARTPGAILMGLSSLSMMGIAAYSAVMTTILA